jgi:hypothetical protein
MSSVPEHPNPLRTASLITAINVLVSAGFSIAGLVAPQTILPPDWLPTDASAMFAAYAAARSVPLALVTLVAIFRRSTSSLILLGMLVGLAQAADAWVGFSQRDAAKFTAPAILAVLQFYAVVLLVRAGSDERVTRAGGAGSPGRDGTA